MGRESQAASLPPPSVREMVDRLGARDEEAARYVFDRFAHRLAAMARSRLNYRIRQKIDPEDVLQSVYLSFFLRNQRGQFDLMDWESLRSVLVVITLRKCQRWNTRFRTQARDVRAEVSVQGESGGGWEPLSREPTPEEAAILADLLEQLLRGLSPRDRQIVRCSLQGMTAPEIGATIGRSERTVLRVLERVKAELNADRGDRHGGGRN
jgi:RNA polymerase sigma-70 factor, ECF subfamily